MGKGKKTSRGSSVTITLPTEPISGKAKTAPVMAVMVQDEGVQILQYEIPLGQSIMFRVGGTIRAYMERVGDAPDTPVWLITGGDNREPVHVEFEHALAGPQAMDIHPGQKLTINPVMARRWEMSAKSWE